MGIKIYEYIRISVNWPKLGKNVYIILEKLSELDIVLEESQRLGISPQLVFAFVLATMGAGKWQNTGGEKSKFWISAAQVLLCFRTAKNSKAY